MDGMVDSVVLFDELLREIIKFCDISTANAFYSTKKSFRSDYVKSPERISECCWEYLTKYSRNFIGQQIVFCYSTKKMDFVESFKITRLVCDKIEGVWGEKVVICCSCAGGLGKALEDLESKKFDGVVFVDEHAPRKTTPKSYAKLYFDRKRNNTSRFENKISFNVIQKQYVPKKVQGGVFIVYL